MRRTTIRIRRLLRLLWLDSVHSSLLSHQCLHHLELLSEQLDSALDSMGPCCYTSCIDEHFEEIIIVG